MMGNSQSISIDKNSEGALEQVWEAYWFLPAGSRSLAVVRVATGVLGLLLCATYGTDLSVWFGPRGWLPIDSVTAWRSSFAYSIFDACETNTHLLVAFYGLVSLFAFLAIGFLTPIASLLAALGWASLLHRGPMLAGPADDSMAILLWCLVIGSSGEHFSVDAILHKRLGWHVSRPRVRTRIAVGLLQVHAAVVSLAALLSQLKGDVWWNGSAVWWIATRKPGQVVDITGLLSQSEYLCNIFTHGVIAWEAFVAVGIWFTVSQKIVARAGLIVWPFVGVLTACPLWGLAMATLTIPLTQLVDETES
jgi:hypothetical protein